MIIDLAYILGAASVSILIFSKFKQPVVLGYLIAGFAVGPHFPLSPNVIDNAGVKIWAEIGVIFLLFGLGLEFSFKKLAKVGKSAFIAASFQITVMNALGYLLGQALGWSTMDSLYLGAALSISSTTIIIRAFGEAGLKGKAFAALVFGILIVQDLLAILIMVILASVSQAGEFSTSNVVFLSGRLIFFLLIWFVVGIYILPSMLKRVRSLLSNEIMLIVSIGLCLLMVVLATKAEFSAALGAFIMGSILAETEEGERIEHLMASVKDLFAAIFFVSVGMLIDPAILKEQFFVILLISLITMIGQPLCAGLGALLSGRSLKHSTQAGMSLTQIGEFSFIFVTLGLSLKVVSDFLYPIIIAVSAVTTFTTPYLIKLSEPTYRWMEKRIPKRILNRLEQYEIAMSSGSSESALQLWWRIYGMLLLLNSVVVLAIGLAAGNLLMPLVVQAFGNDPSIRFAAGILTLIVCSPFLYAIVLKAPRKLANAHAPTLLRLRRLQIGIAVFRSAIGLVLIEVILLQFSDTGILPLGVLVATPILIFVFKRYIKKFYYLFERRFLENLNAKALSEMKALEKLPQLAPWDASLVQMVVSPDSRIAGLSLLESKFRSTTGATVAMIDRGHRRIFAPNRDQRILPNDQLYLIGTDSQLALAQKLTQEEVLDDGPSHDELFNLESFVINEGSKYADKSIREIGLGEEFGSLIVGVERAGSRLLNPESPHILKAGDLIWVFGHRNRLKELKRGT